MKYRNLPFKNELSFMKKILVFVICILSILVTACSGKMQQRSDINPAKYIIKNGFILNYKNVRLTIPLKWKYIEPSDKEAIAEYISENGKIKGKLYKREITEDKPLNELFDDLIGYGKLTKPLWYLKKAFSSKGYGACFEWGDRAYLFKGLFVNDIYMYYLKITALRPKIEDEEKEKSLQDSFIRLFYSTEVNVDNKEISRNLFNIKVILPDNEWVFKKTDRDQVAILFNQFRKVSVIIQKIDQIEKDISISDKMKDLINKLKTKVAEDEYDFETKLDQILPSKVDAIKMTINRVKTEHNLKVNVIKYYFIYKKRIFEISIIHQYESEKEENNEEKNEEEKKDENNEEEKEKKKKKVSMPNLINKVLDNIQLQ